MRVALAGFFHESNTFNPAVTTRAHYEASRLYRGAAIVEHLAGTDSEMAGFLGGDFEPLPALVAWTWPLGPLTRECFDGILDELCAALDAARPFDGCLLSIHGAMVAQGVPDADAVILERVRAVVGDVPLIVTFDLHANLHPRMAGLCDALIGYHTYPHVDLRARGAEAATLMERTLRGEVRPVLALSKVPLVPHIMTMPTASGPAAELFKVADRVARQPGILSTSVALGFAYADVPHLGLTAVAVADGDRDAAQRAADSIATAAWERRERFWIDCPSPADAVMRAVNAAAGPVILADIGDNLGGGTPGDGTYLLRLLLDLHAEDAVVVLYDPDAAAACQAAGVGAEVTLQVGGKQDRLHGDPVAVTGRVKALTDGVFRNRGPMRDGLLDDQGATAVLDIPCGPLVLTSKRMPSWNLEQLRSCGIEPTRMKIIVSKGALAHRAAYEPIATELIDVDTPGVTPADYRQLTYTRVNRPLYRLDAESDFRPERTGRIDCHTHIGVELAHYLTGAFPYAQHFEGLCRDLDLAGMDQAVVFPMATHLQMGLRALAGKANQPVSPAPAGKPGEQGQRLGSDEEPVKELHCSFCSKSRVQVRKLIAGPNVHICNECIDLCNDILEEGQNAAVSAFPFGFENAHFLTEIYDLFGDLSHRAIPLVILDPSRQTSEQIEAIEKLAERYPIAGLKLQATMIQAHVTDLPGSGFLELAERHNWPMLIHCAVHPEDPWSQVKDILDVVEGCPHVRFNVAHTLRFDRPAIERLAALPNAWFDVSAFCIHCDLAVKDSPVVAPPERRLEADYADPGRALLAFAEAWPERILWGSDTPYYSYVAVVTRPDGTREPYDLRSDMQREVAALHALPQDLQDRMTGGNPRAWLYGEG